jgi:hypothetical protein
MCEIAGDLSWFCHGSWFLVARKGDIATRPSETGGEQFFAQDKEFQISYAGGTGYDVTLEFHYLIAVRSMRSAWPANRVTTCEFRTASFSLTKAMCRSAMNPGRLRMSKFAALECRTQMSSSPRVATSSSATIRQTVTTAGSGVMCRRRASRAESFSDIGP